MTIFDKNASAIGMGTKVTVPNNNLPGYPERIFTINGIDYKSQEILLMSFPENKFSGWHKASNVEKRD